MAKNSQRATGEIPLCKDEKLPDHGLFCCKVEVPFFLADHKTSITIDKQVMTF